MSELEFEYGPVYDIASLTLGGPVPDGSIVEEVLVERASADIYLGFNTSGHLVEIEVLGASSVLPASLLSAAQLMDEGPTPEYDG